MSQTMQKLYFCVWHQNLMLQTVRRISGTSRCGDVPLKNRSDLWERVSVKLWTISILPAAHSYFSNLGLEEQRLFCSDWWAKGWSEWSRDQNGWLLSSNNVSAKTSAVARANTKSYGCLQVEIVAASSSSSSAFWGTFSRNIRNISG